MMAKRDKKKIIRVAVIGDTFRANGGSTISDLNMQMYGCLDPDTEMLGGVSKEMWGVAYPKMRRANNHSGVVMIFGTGGNGDGKDFFKFWENELPHKDLFIPATVANTSKFPFLKNNKAEPKIFDQNGNVHWSDASYTVAPKMVGYQERHKKWLKENPPMPYDPNELIDKDKLTEMINKLSKR